MDRRARFLLCKLILQALCCDALFCDFEIFPTLLPFQKPKHLKEALFKEYETCREMSPRAVECEQS